MNNEIAEHKISFTIIPETYDYTDGEIVYRIFLETKHGLQLLVERALPELSEGQGLLENFTLKKISEKSRFSLFSVTEKKVVAKELYLSNTIVKNIYYFTNKLTDYGYVSFDMVPNRFPNSNK